MNPNPRLRWKYAVAFAVVSTVAVEAVTVAVRFGAGHSAADFIATAPPLLMRIHHMFWCIPLLAVLPAVWQFQKTSGALASFSSVTPPPQYLEQFLVVFPVLLPDGFNF